MNKRNITIHLTDEELNTIHSALDYTFNKYNLYKADKFKENIKNTKKTLVDEYYKFMGWE